MIKNCTVPFKSFRFMTSIYIKFRDIFGGIKGVWLEMFINGWVRSVAHLHVACPAYIDTVIRFAVWVVDQEVEAAS